MLAELEHLLSFQNVPKFFEDRLKVSLWKSDVAEPVNVGKLRASFLRENDGALKPQPPLEQASFMDDIFASMSGCVNMDILCRHHQKSKTHGIEQGFEAFRCTDAGYRFGVEFIATQMQSVGQK